MLPAYIGLRRTLESLVWHRPRLVDWRDAWPVPRPLIFVANHPGTMDPAVLAAHIRRDLGEPAFFVAMHKVAKVFGPELTFKWFWIITIDERKRSNCLLQIENVLRRGYRVFIFPGGKLDYGQRLTLDGVQSGAALIAHRTGVSICPIGYWGPPNKSRTFSEFVAGVFGRHPVGIKAGSVIQVQKIAGRIPKDIIRQTMARVVAQINELVDQVRDQLPF